MVDRKVFDSMTSRWTHDWTLVATSRAKPRTCTWRKVAIFSWLAQGLVEELFLFPENPSFGHRTSLLSSQISFCFLQTPYSRSNFSWYILAL